VKIPQLLPTTENIIVQLSLFTTRAYITNEWFLFLYTVIGLFTTGH